VSTSYRTVITFHHCVLQMDELTTLMAAMCQFIDVVGSYQLPPEARKKAEKRRQEVRCLQYALTQ
jgi:Protein of unknown function (DUF1682)